MAVYKVPQDVEAEDKLLGPFSFRQFIYLVIAVLGGGLAYFLGTVFVGLAVIPVPIIIIFLILALPLKKDQPMEIYAAAVLSFYLKPRRKIWDPDSIMTLAEFTNDKPLDSKNSGPDISFNEARQRISFLSDLVDSNGAIIKTPTANPALQTDIVAEASQVEDIHDEDALINQKFDLMINQNNQERREQLLENLQNSAPITSTPQSSNQLAAAPINYTSPHPGNFAPAAPDFTITPPPAPPQPIIPPAPNWPAPPNFDYQSNHPNNLNTMSTVSLQSQPPVIESPIIETESLSTSISQPTPNSAEQSLDHAAFHPSPDIINLANNNDLSIQTIASEAKKISDRNKKLLGEEDEVVISLR